MLDVMLGIGDQTWSDTIHDLTVIRNVLAIAIRKKMSALPRGGIIAVANHEQLTGMETETLPGIIADLLNDAAFSDFERYTLIVLNRWNSLQFWSVLLRRGQQICMRKSDL